MKIEVKLGECVKKAFKFVMAASLFILAIYISSFAFTDSNSTAADIHLAIAFLLFIGGYAVICVKL